MDKDEIIKRLIELGVTEEDINRRVTYLLETLLRNIQNII